MKRLAKCVGVVIGQEIVNLCDSWNDDQEADGDRISTLLTCFMMVAQCVPDLGKIKTLTLLAKHITE